MGESRRSVSMEPVLKGSQRIPGGLWNAQPLCSQTGSGGGLDAGTHTGDNFQRPIRQKSAAALNLEQGLVLMTAPV